MDIRNTKVKDLGKAAVENMKEMGADMLNKTEAEIKELKEKMMKNK